MIMVKQMDTTFRQCDSQEMQKKNSNFSRHHINITASHLAAKLHNCYVLNLNYKIMHV